MHRRTGDPARRIRGRSWCRSVQEAYRGSRARQNGATRTLVAKEGVHGIFFIAGRQKSDPGADFSDASVAQAQVIAQALQKTSAKKLDALIEDGVLKEICHGGQEI